MKKRGIWVSEREFVAFPGGKNVSLAGELATRQRSVDFYSIGMYLPDPDPVLKKQGKDMRIYKELLSDAHVWSCVASRRAGVRSLEWAVDRGKARSRPAKVVEDLFGRINVGRLVSEILDAVLFGFKPMEVMWERRDGLVLPERVVGKPPEWFAFSEENELLFRTKDKPNGAPVPARKFLCPRHEASYDNPYGERTLSRVFWPVTFKRGGLRFWVTFMEKYGMPFLVGHLPRGTAQEEADKLAGMLETMVQDAIAVIPDDSSVEVKDAGEKRASAAIYREMIDAMNAEVSKAVLGQTLTTEMGATGSFAAANVHLQVRKDIVDADRALVAETLNQLIGWIMELNFSGGEAPVFSMWEEEDVDKALAERDETLTRAGVRFARKYWTRAYGFEDGDIAGKKKGEEEEFAEGDRGKAPFPDQQATDEALESFTPEELQEQMEGVLKPVLDLIASEKDYDAVLSKLAEAWPEMDDEALEQMLARAIFVSELWGRLSAGGAEDAGR